MVRLFFQSGYGGMGTPVLPEGGGVLNQLSLIMQAMSCIQSIEAEYRESSD